MANQYTWKIEQLQCYPESGGRSDVVFKVHWRRFATDGTYIADVYGEQAVAINPAEPFTAYADLTEAQVIVWLESAMGVGMIQSYDSILDRRIEDQIRPPVINPPLPWSPAV
jgi:hypothetical protein